MVLIYRQILEENSLIYENVFRNNFIKFLNI